MATESDSAAKELQDLSLEKDSSSAGAVSKRTRAGLQDKKTQMSQLPALCNTEGSISGFSRIETRSQRQSKVLKEHTASNAAPERTRSANFTFTNYFIPVVKNFMPLPELDWADPKEVWSNMLQKDRKYCRDPLYFRKHSFLQPRMRTILLDWLTEVCEVYKLHRETYYLALDFVDRYLSIKHDIAKQRLQLEIYPPKISEFAYVTDGACTESEILDQELLMLKTLDWKLTPITINSWLNIYLQLSCVASEKSTCRKETFHLPNYPQQEFVKVAQLLDLCVLDTGSLQFSYSILTASALNHMLPVKIEQVTGHSWEELYPCIQWMKCFSDVILEKGSATLKNFESVPREDTHNIQTHAVEIGLLEKAQSLQNSHRSASTENRSMSPVVGTLGPPTPPSSTKKPITSPVIVIE
ncbi:G1/S-specific cyclin-E1 [Acropora cervicornis]|uniref:G1/S-specific cyclin-E1 n=1 Tax=Acropora cervicornis TaxID=6130 RepID=A0AAD9UU45_ACRCE|nr:G1/S-specific cyclin-E1 [Acropora cervicornis]